MTNAITSWTILFLLVIAVVYDVQNIPTGCLAAAIFLVCNQLYGRIHALEAKLEIEGGK